MSIAVIGGTGLDEMAEFASAKHKHVTTRFGSADIYETVFGGQDIIFLPRHGIGHSIAPNEIDYRAQIAALKSLEVTRVIAVCAVGALQKDISAGSFAVLGDFIDMTRRRACTFFDTPGEPVVHTDMSIPYCPEISLALADACESQKVRYITSAVYVGVDGPRYESPAEIRLYGSWGGHVIGMTGLPEAVLAREAGICYGSLAVVTNAAAGHAASISHDEVRATMKTAGGKLLSIIERVLEAVPSARNCDCGLKW